MPNRKSRKFDLRRCFVAVEHLSRRLITPPFQMRTQHASAQGSRAVHFHLPSSRRRPAGRRLRHRSVPGPSMPAPLVPGPLNRGPVSAPRDPRRDPGPEPLLAHRCAAGPHCQPEPQVRAGRARESATPTGAGAASAAGLHRRPDCRDP